MTKTSDNTMTAIESHDWVAAYPGSRTCPGRILVVDDEETFRESTIVLLQREGYEARGVADRPSAEEELRHHHYDLMISDIKMPGNEELELVHAARALASNMATILVTGYPSVQTAVPAVDLRISAYLIKPVDPAGLIELVRNTLAQARAYRLLDECVHRAAERNREPSSPESDRSKGGTDEISRSLGQVVDLMMGDLNGTLSDLRTITQVYSSGTPSAELAQAFSSIRPIGLTAALQDAVHSIERTRQNFKSSELASLRERLESLMRDRPARPGQEHRR